MNTKSETEFQWSVKLTGDQFFHVGLATKFKCRNERIYNHDSEAIFYSSVGNVLVGQKHHRNLPEQHSGDIISFRFHPQTKKLFIRLTRVVKFHEWTVSVAVKDNINYFPFAQLCGGDALDANLINYDSKT